jgi:hypothetical protein
MAVDLTSNYQEVKGKGAAHTITGHESPEVE